jgi:UDP-glucuronate 4-epimerase
MLRSWGGRGWQLARPREVRAAHLPRRPVSVTRCKIPHAYLEANLAGFLNVLEGCRHRKTDHLVFASSSSVYGANARLPFSVHDNVDHPISFYAATKKADELMAHTYNHLYGLPATVVRCRRKKWAAGIGWSARVLNEHRTSD